MGGEEVGVSLAVFPMKTLRQREFRDFFQRVAVFFFSFFFLVLSTVASFDKFFLMEN